MNKLYPHHSEEELKQIIETTMNSFTKEEIDEMIEELNKTLESSIYFMMKRINLKQI